MEAARDADSSPPATTAATSSGASAGRTPRPLLRASRSNRRARRSFASRNSRSLTIDAEPTSGWDGCGAGQSTPASTSSSSCSDAVPWWELEYQCPPPGTLGAHEVPVSVEEPPSAGAGQTERSVASWSASPVSQFHARRPVLTLNETRERALRRPRGLSASALPSTPSLFVDNSPREQRKTRRLHVRDPSELLSVGAAKELKRAHDSSKACELEPPRGRQRVLTPSTLLQPLTQIGISQSRAPPAETTSSVVEDTSTPREPSDAPKPDYAASC